MKKRKKVKEISPGIWVGGFEMPAVKKKRKKSLVGYTYKKWELNAMNFDWLLVPRINLNKRRLLGSNYKTKVRITVQEI
ncbi:MAG TPA: hypothetical protein ENH87_11140 [Pricia antarctica]|uniref:Uncharacterized protein n=1 Tax=Pricia antarctica TaxID=641691 RepID=A0A831QR53_9FLAO|nr:hypothetical protein [Pricia antarctica]